MIYISSEATFVSLCLIIYIHVSALKISRYILIISLGTDPVHTDAAHRGSGAAVDHRAPPVRHQRQHDTAHGGGEGSAPDPCLHGHHPAAAELLPPPERRVYSVPRRAAHHDQSQSIDDRSRGRGEGRLPPTEH